MPIGGNKKGKPGGMGPAFGWLQLKPQPRIGFCQAWLYKGGRPTRLMHLCAPESSLDRVCPSPWNNHKNGRGGGGLPHLFGARVPCQPHQPLVTGPLPRRFPICPGRPMSASTIQSADAWGVATAGPGTSKKRPSNLVKAGRSPGLSPGRQLCSSTSKDRLNLQVGGQEGEGPGLQERPAGRRLEGWDFQSKECRAIWSVTPRLLGSCRWNFWGEKMDDCAGL